MIIRIIHNVHSYYGYGHHFSYIIGIVIIIIIIISSSSSSTSIIVIIGDVRYCYRAAPPDN